MNPRTMMKTRSIHLVLGTATLLAGFALQTNAALIAYENFDYGTSTSINGQTGGTGWDGGWATSGTSLATASADQSLWFGQSPVLITDGSSHVGLNNSNASNVRDLGTTIDLDVDVLYFSMLFRVESSTAATITASFGRSSDNVTRGTVQLSGGKLGVDATTGGIVQTAGNVYTTNENYMLVMKRVGVADGGAVFASVFAGDGTLGTTLASEPGSWQVSETGLSGLDVDRMFIDITGGGSVTRIDEIRVGTDWASVIPEPGSSILVGLAGMIMLARRRR